MVFKTLPAKVDAVFYFPPFGPKPTKRKTARGVVQKNNRPEPDNVMSISSGAKGETISEKVFNIIQTIESSGDISIKKSPVRTSCWPRFLRKRTNCKKNLNEETLTLASSLIKLGADKEKNRRCSQRQKARLSPDCSEGRWPEATRTNRSKACGLLSPNKIWRRRATSPAGRFWQNNEKLKNLLEPRPFLS